MPSENEPVSILFVVGLFLGFSVVFAAFWCGVVYLISRMSGWSALATVYAARDGVAPSRLRGRTAYLRLGTRYTGTLNFDADATGFRVAPMVLFRPGHETLLIPWSDVTTEDSRLMLFSMTRLRFARCDVPMYLRPRFAQELLSARR